MMVRAARWGRGLRLAALLAVVVGTNAGPAAAADPMVVFLGHVTVLRLSSPAERVIVGNPAVADVTVDSPRTVSVFGKAPGETNLVIMGAKERTLVARSLIVADQPDHRVAVYVPGKDGPTARLYSCVDSGCLRVPTADATAASSGAAKPPAAPSPAAPAQ